LINVQANSKAAYELLHEGTLALAEIEQNGIRLDVDYCIREIKRLERRIEQKEKQILDYKEVKMWKAKYGPRFKLGSDQQLADILFNEMGLTSTVKTDSGNYSVNAAALEGMDVPFVKEIVDMERLKKMKGTYLENFMLEQVDGYVHPFFNLTMPVTYRSSSDSPNFQNMPIRHPENKKIIRSAFLPRPGHRLGGIDYSGIEVKIAFCYHQDPNMYLYLMDPEKDMHRDTSMDCYMLSIDEWTKDTRYCAKNKFVFPQFYGDWWKTCAENLWAAIDIMQLKTKQEVPLKEHLRDKGIKGLGSIGEDGKPSAGSFYKHIQEVENTFWFERFPVYTQWKKEQLKYYEKNGYVDMFTGFRCSGLMGKNEVLNYPIQGAAFHCLLRSVIELNKWIKREKLRSKVVGQIHDEATMDVHGEEFQYVLMNAKKIMCDDIREEWKWITIPLGIEADFSEVDQNWFHKKTVEIDDFIEKIPY
jgi:DNA polymerase I